MFRIIAILLVATMLSGPEESPEIPHTPEVEAVSIPPGLDGGQQVPVFAPRLDGEQQVLVEFALERFARANLELPPELQIIFPDDQSECLGYGGLYVRSKIEVRICRPSDTTMLHELAHAWIETTLNDAEREAFLDLRQLDTWTGGSEWDRRGAEQAAEVLTWALMDRDITFRWLDPGLDNTWVETYRLLKFGNSSHDELATAYKMLTGSNPVDRSARSGETESGPDLVSVEARRSGAGQAIKVGGLRHNGVVVSPEAIQRTFNSSRVSRC